MRFARPAGGVCGPAIGCGNDGRVNEQAAVFSPFGERAVHERRRFADLPG
jgi:hypothetical protein